MFSKIMYTTLLIIATIAFVSGIGALLSTASWVCNILGVVLVPVYGCLMSRLVKRLF